MSRDTAHGVLVHHNDIVPESLVDMPDDQKIKIVPRSKNPNTSLFFIAKEDHTIGNLLQRKLHENPMVVTAGYRVPHPTKHTIEVRVQTGADQSGREIPTPNRALEIALESCISDFVTLRERFLEEARINQIPIEGT